MVSVPEDGELRMGLPQDLITDLHDVLSKCDCFESNEALKAVFMDQRIYPLRNQVPEATKKGQRISLTIEFLYQQGYLLSFLHALIINQSTMPIPKSELKALVKKLQEHLPQEYGLEIPLDTKDTQNESHSQLQNNQSPDFSSFQRLVLGGVFFLLAVVFLNSQLNGTPAATLTPDASIMAVGTGTPTATPPPTSPAIATDPASSPLSLVSSATATLEPCSPPELPVLSLTPAPTVTTSSKDCMPMVFVPASEVGNGEKGFWIDQVEVTNAMYERCVTDGACSPSPDVSSDTRGQYYGNLEFAHYPVIRVPWEMAKTYCEWAGRRLPKKEEWQKAAQGNDGREYPWGNQPIDGRRANFCDKQCDPDDFGPQRTAVAAAGLDEIDDGFEDTAPVGTYPAGASPYGALDMSGNVWEWIFDPQDTMCGGSWSRDHTEVRISGCQTATQEKIDQWGLVGVGFRCARDAP